MSKKTLWICKPTTGATTVFGNLTNLDAIRLKNEAGLKSLHMVAVKGLDETPYDEAMAKAMAYQEV